MRRNLFLRVNFLLVKGQVHCLILSVVSFFFYPSPFSIRQIQNSSKLTEFSDNNSKFNENDRKFSKWIENTVGEKEKFLVTIIFSFYYSIFKRLVLQTRKNQGMFRKGLILFKTTNFKLCKLKEFPDDNLNDKWCKVLQGRAHSEKREILNQERLDEEPIP